MHLVLIETSGNQNYIFSTNKLKENIGASELTYQAGTKWVLEAVAQVSDLKLWDSDRKKLRENLLNASLNKQIDSSNDIKVEVIVATSGKAILLTRNHETAKKIIHEVTYRALREAPGLDICGVSREFEWETHRLGEVIREVYKKFQSVRSQRPSPNLRFLRLPVVDECSTSGLPASLQVDTISQKHISSVSAAKQAQSEQALVRISSLFKKDPPSIRSVKTIRELNTRFEEEVDWLSVIHADGNGLGEIFLSLGNHVTNNRNYVNSYKKFSIALDICTEKAFLEALNVFTTKSKVLNLDKNKQEVIIPIIPLILGGDDLTVVCDGKFALEFTQLFLKAFEGETASGHHVDGIIPEIAKTALGVSRLSACAGVTIIKPHFPFSVAYELSEKLMKSAKVVKKKVVNSENNRSHPCSALDFHILYDSSQVELERIRNKLEIKSGQEKNQLHKRPYVVTSEAELQGAKCLEWANFHQWTKLQKQTKALLAKDNEGRRQLPNSQMHELRSALFLGREVADARYKLIRDRYLNEEIITLAGSEDSLFQLEPDSGIYMTGLLDALDVSDFLKIESEVDEQEK